MIRSTLPIGLPALFLGCFLAACSGSSGSSKGGLGILPAEPAGILLAGAPGAPAADSVRTMLSSPVGPAEVLDGLLTTRLEAIIAPGATVSEVNDTLTARNMRIVAMRSGYPMLVLVVPPVVDQLEAKSVAAELESTQAFELVTHSRSAPNVSAVLAAGSVDFLLESPPPTTLPAISSQLQALRMHAAKNAGGLNLENGNDVVIALVHDHFGQALADPRISAQFVVGIGQGGYEAEQIGNRGFEAIGIIAVDPEYTEFDPVHPTAREHMLLMTTPIGGLTWWDRMFDLVGVMESLEPSISPQSGGLIVHTAYNYGPSFDDDRSLLFRAVDAQFWRSIIRDIDYEFLHVTSAGDWGEQSGLSAQAHWASPYALAEAFGDLAQVVSLALGSEAGDSFLAFFNGELAPSHGGLRIIGSAHAVSRARSPFSSGVADLHAVGEDVFAPCTLELGNCLGGMTTISSTRAATAQAAGVFAYLWNLAPTFSVAELIQAVDRSALAGAGPGLIDAYYATLSLDDSIANPAIRREILDVAFGFDSFHVTGNGLFDEHDLQVFLDAFDAGTDLRYDLNGDGQVGSGGRSLFDLDINVPPLIDTVMQDVEGTMRSFDEGSVTDLEILTYYAYSFLYAGDTDRRCELLEGCVAVPQGTELRSASRTVRTDASFTSFHSDRFDGEGFFSGSSSSSDTESDGGAVASTSASASAESDIVLDADGNLVSLTEEGSANVNFSLTNPGSTQLLAPCANGFSQLDVVFKVEGNDARFSLDLNIDGTVSGDEAFGEYSEVQVRILLTDTQTGFQHINVKRATPDFQLPAILSFRGTLPAGLSFRLSVDIETEALYDFTTAPLPARISAAAISNWDYAFSLDQ